MIRSPGSFPGVGIDPDAATLIAAMTTAPNAARQEVISDHIVALKAAGVWTLLDAYWMLAAHDEQASRLNWRNPAAHALTTAGVITFTADRGWQGNGSSGYLNTNWTPATHGVNFALNSASFGVYNRTNAANNNVSIGARRADMTRWTYLFANRTTGPAGITAFINQNTTTFVSSTATPQGLPVARRTGSSSTSVLKNGVELATGAELSTALVDFPFFISSLNTSGSPSSFDNRQFASAFTGAAMTDAQHLALYQAQQNGYLAAVGAAV